MFATEQIARTTLGRNHGRIAASIDKCTEAVLKIQPSKVIDVGGGCGIVCFHAALKRPESRFVVVDRSTNALTIGTKWAKDLDLGNVSFRRFDFTSANRVSTLGCNYDFALLEYVFDVDPDCDDTDEIVEGMMPALLTASRILRSEAPLQIRFGAFSEIGLSALVRSACRAGFFVSSVLVARDGCTLSLKQGGGANHAEDSEVLRVLEDFSFQCQA